LILLNTTQDDISKSYHEKKGEKMRHLIILLLTIVLLNCGHLACTVGNTKNDSQHAFSTISSNTFQNGTIPLISQKKNEDNQDHSPKSGNPRFFTKEEIQEMGYGTNSLSPNSTLYGRIIDYIGQTQTQKGDDLLFIQSAERMHHVELDGYYNDPVYEVDLICLSVNSKEDEWNCNDTTKTLWSFPLHNARIHGVYFDDKYMYIGTMDRLDKNNLNESDLCVLCLNKETGEQVWKQDIVGEVTTEFVLHSSRLYFGAGSSEKSILYALSTKDGSCMQKVVSQCNTISCLFATENGLYYSPFCHSEQPLRIYHYSFTTKKETLLWNGEKFYKEADILNRSELLLADSTLYFVASAYESTTKDEYIQYITVFSFNLNKDRLNWSKKIEVSHGPSLNELLYAENTLYIASYGGAWTTGFKSFCIAFDTKSQTIRWENTLEGFVIEQAVLGFNHLYLIVSPQETEEFKKFGFIDHNQQALELDTMTGELIGKAPPSPFNGIARIVGTYRNNLITQGPGKSYLQFGNVHD